MPKWLALLYIPALVFLSTGAFAQISNSPYVVDGLALGGHVNFDSNAYRQYDCGPSDKFAGFTWCHKEETEDTRRGEVLFANSILHSGDGTAWYINRYIEPAFFNPGDVQNEIEQLSARFGQHPRIFRLPPGDGLPNAVIAVWGKVELQQLDAADVSTFASGGTVKGLLISYLGDVQRSAKAGVPVYRIAGGAGFIWAPTYNRDGRGVLRFLAVDASKIESLPQIAGIPPLYDTASVLVPLKNDGGTYKVPVLINQAIKLDFIVDSGATDVTIPEDVFLTLIRTGTIQDSDIIGEQTFGLADGSKVSSKTFRIRSLTVGNTTLENIIGSVTPVQGSLLLGQSFLSRFRSWSIDNSKELLLLFE